ncbi:tetratricopeptide repeat-containing sulfotransferase family protein [Novosphingobium taihuense]|uniref:Putative Zn-dependent protease n=1 Tax=Novosphingobium taihuense TaxID=260085 RepID=A0A7W7A7Q4_9SPHN|nr:tetratricopeptide repeat-containing sulfotransferase family protein [Novosphingobium taihuense]MBB4611906.1 putative Zn-dependent protease [Novosphingobium taihuense]TWH88739.1 tetratricopeptide repeat protein [Novosphingobium taihuense]
MIQHLRAPSPQQALAEGEALLASAPHKALTAAETVLRQAPGFPPAEFLAARALRRMGKGKQALAKLDALARNNGRVPAVLWELGQVASDQNDAPRAIAALQALTQLQPAVAGGWFLLARQLRKAGRAQDAWRADLSGVHASSRDTGLLKAAVAVNDGDLDGADAMLAERLARESDDPPALRLHGEVAWRKGEMTPAIARVEQAVALAPGFDLARDFLIRLLLQTNRLPEALEHAEVLQGSPIPASGHKLILASVLVRLGHQERAAGLYRELLAGDPDQPQVWQNLGHVLKTLGRQAEAVEAYRAAVTRQPTMGEAWWSLANLKTVKLNADDIATMEQALASLSDAVDERKEDVFHLHFSLGKAFEDAKNAESAFAHYDKGNALRRTMILHDADAFAADVEAAKQTFSAAFIASMGEGGCPAPDPIFVVGLPRSGSTLVEQILSSHPMIEGTMELPEMMMIGARLQSRVDEGEFADFATMTASLTPADRQRLGEEYIERTRIHRQTDRPLFIDKMPNNWQHTGLIRLILPNAKIVDARRHPLSCCFSGWKQHFARGQTFTYDLTDIGRYYRDYVGLMAAWDAQIPGHVHRVIYERMVADTEAEVRRLLDYIGVPFDPACLEFYKNDRAVRTASSEQVRQPIFKDGLEAWKPYEPWLGPLKAALGPVLESYPDAPLA